MASEEIWAFDVFLNVDWRPQIDWGSTGLRQPTIYEIVYCQPLKSNCGSTINDRATNHGLLHPTKNSQTFKDVGVTRNWCDCSASSETIFNLDDHVSSPNDTFKVCLNDHQLKCGPRIFAKMLLLFSTTSIKGQWRRKFYW